MVKFASTKKINKYDIILMDLFMPEMDGNETTHYIRDIMNLDIPIIGLSANTCE
jgi:CheY-like chemotaxis protein